MRRAERGRGDGGSIGRIDPRLCFNHGERGFDWTWRELFFVDERVVPPTIRRAITG